MRWGNFVYGGSRVAWCFDCATTIANWTQPWSQEGLPMSVRRKVEDHRAVHEPVQAVLL